jgi:hypothetical protein
VIQPQPSQNLRAFHARKHPIKNDCVVTIGRRKVKAGDAVPDGIKLMPSGLEVGQNLQSDFSIALNH